MVTIENRPDSTSNGRRPKRVGFAPEVGVNGHVGGSEVSPSQADPPVTNERPHPWDNETNHMLSYFLGGGDGQFTAMGIPDLPQSEFLNNEQHEKLSADPAFEPAFGMPKLPPGATISNPKTVADSCNAGFSWVNNDNVDTEQDDDEEEPIAPPTPKLPQFYSRSFASNSNSTQRTMPQDSRSGRDAMDSSAHYSGECVARNTILNGTPSTAQSALQSTASSSSSSLSSMANTLVTGGPMLLQQIRQEQQHHHQPYASTVAAGALQQLQQLPGNHQPHQPQQCQSGESPVSPAAMIGTPENLMLPLPIQNVLVNDSHQGGLAVAEQGSGTSSESQPPPQPPHPTSDPASQELHLAWLRGINAMVKAGRPQNLPRPLQLVQQAIVEPQHTTPQAMQLGLPFAAYPHMAFYGHAAAAAVAALQQGIASPEESEEKRAKRLERNRESARISRRRKKERLTAAEARVRRTHQKIAHERQKQIEKLLPGLRKLRNKKLLTFLEEGISDPAAIMTAVRETGPNSAIFQAAIEFQFTALQASLFPRYQKLWLWLALNEEQYFSSGKEVFSKRDPEKIAIRVLSGKISSKQVGEELMNGANQLDTAPVESAEARHPDDQAAARTCYANDSARMWPLFCYEHKWSVDQEDKFLGLYKRIRQNTHVAASWKKSSEALKAASSLRHAMEFVCRIASNREEQLLVGVLRPDQISKYRQWIVMNHDRCSRSLRMHHAQQREDTSNARIDKESLTDICRRLERVVRISSNDNGEHSI